MTNLKELLDLQFADDFCCTAAEVRSAENIFTVFEKREGQRAFCDGAFLQIACVHGKFLATGDAAVIARLEKSMKTASAPWLMDLGGLRRIDGMLKEFGYQIGMAHPFYLAEKASAPRPVRGETKWYFGGEIEAFRGDGRFGEAYAFQPACPDVMGVSLEREGQILGMAGASRDSARMYQIGINVMPEGKGQGIGTYLVTLLKNKIIENGVLPFYGTAQSHIASQKVALASGFAPAWAELYAGKIE